MSWVQIVWPMLAAASLTVGLIHALIWARERSAMQHLAFACAALSLSALTVLELIALDVRAPDELARLIRWMHVPVVALVVSLVAFARFSFGPKYFALAITAVAVRLMAFVLNFTTGVNLNFASIESVGRVLWPGDAWVPYPIGTPNPWVIVGQASNVMIVVYMTLVLAAALRSDNAQRRRDAAIVCGGWLLFVLLMMTAAAVMTLSIGKMPFIGSPSFVFVLAAMSYQLGSNLFESNRLVMRLQESELARLQDQLLLQRAADSGGLGLWSWSVVEDRVVASPKVREWLGDCVRDGDLDLAGVMRLILSSDRPRVREAIDTALKSGQFASTFRLSRQPFERWLTVKGEVEFDVDGRPVAMRGVVRDDTERQLSGGRFRALLEAAPSAILLVDSAGLICLLNAEAERMFGYAREELLGLEIERLLPEGMRVRHVQHRRDYTRSPQKRVMGDGRELRGLRWDGTEFPIELGLNPIRFGAEMLVLVAVTDMTEHRRKDAELSLRREEVAHLSRVTMLGELSGSLAHELNQPLAAILSNAQAAQRMLLRNPEDLTEIREILSDIVDNDRRAGEVIRRLRTLLRKGAREVAAIDVNQVITDSLQLLRNDLRNRGVVVVHDLSPGLPAVEGDQVQLQQVLLNLIFNACDAMAALDSRRLCLQSMQMNDSVRITVVDGGPGVPPEMLERIFEPFQTTKPNGLGLGLAICRTIVESHHGRLWAENGTDGGARLHIELPALDRS